MFAFFGQQIFQAGFQLLDLPVQLLGFAAELHAPQLGQLQLKLFDFQRAHAERLLQRRYCVPQLLQFAVALKQQCPQGFDIVRQSIRDGWHARSLRALR
jgi:hypothetical protein